MKPVVDPVHLGAIPCTLHAKAAVDIFDAPTHQPVPLNPPQIPSKFGLIALVIAESASETYAKR